MLRDGEAGVSNGNPIGRCEWHRRTPYTHDPVFIIDSSGLSCALALLIAMLLNFQEIIHHQALRYINRVHVSSFPHNIGVFRPFSGENIHRGLHAAGGNVNSRCAAENGDYVKEFRLSDCVRYKQEFRGKVVQGESEGSLGLINLSISTARMRFPNLF